MHTLTTNASEWSRMLYRDHAPALRGLVLRLTATDHQRTEDVVQETFLRAWRNMAYLVEHPCAVRPWLCTVARRIVVDEHRRRMARPPEVGSEPLEIVAVPDESDALVIGMIVRDALRALNASHRAVIRELYFRGRTMEQAAAVLGIPHGTVKSRSYYALRALRLALAERGIAGLSD